VRMRTQSDVASVVPRGSGSVRTRSDRPRQEPQTTALDVQPRPLAGVLRVGDERRARLMCADIMSSDRMYPIVGLSCHSGNGSDDFAWLHHDGVKWPHLCRSFCCW
jgi:hypothetical protein